MALERWFWSTVDAATPYDRLLGILNSRFAKLVGIVKALCTTVDALPTRLSASATLNFTAPAAVPGQVSQTVTVTGAAFGHRVTVGAPVAVGPNYTLSGFVSATNTVTVRWWQLTGAAADPDAGGGTYTIDVWQ